MLKAKDFREKSTEELEITLLEKRKELFVFLNSMKLEKKPVESANYNRIRKEIARLLTVIRERQLAAV